MSTSDLTVRELLDMHETALAELRCRGVVRTNDSPSGRYAEWLARQVLGGTLAPNSEKSYDLEIPDGTRIQVKCRVVRNGNAGELQLSPFRSFDFDQALIILFNTSYDVQRAVLLTADLARKIARWRDYVRAFVLIASDTALDQGDDVTARFLSAS